MITNLLSAVPYADIVFFVILGLGLLGGIFGGLAKALKGFFKSIAIILVSLLLVGATLAPICEIGAVKDMTASFSSKAEGWGAVFSEPIHIADDGSYYIEVEYDGTINKIQLQNAGDGFVEQSKAKFANWLAGRFIEKDGQTLADACAKMLTSIIVSVIAFILYCIVLALLCWLLRKIFKNMHDSDSGAVRIIDRTLGAIVATGLALLFILLVLAILHALAKTIPTVHEYLSSSKVCGFFYEHNPISTVFQSIFG